MIADWEEGNFMPQPSGKVVSIHQKMQIPFDIVIFQEFILKIYLQLGSNK